MFEKKAIPVSERWAIAYGTADSAELRALELLSEGLSTYVTEYTLEIRQASEMPEDGNVILIGMADSQSSDHRAAGHAGIACAGLSPEGDGSPRTCGKAACPYCGCGSARSPVRLH